MLTPEQHRHTAASPSPRTMIVRVAGDEVGRGRYETMLGEWREKIPGYVLERVLGVGGSSCVFLARQVSLGREVAIKVLLHEGPEQDMLAGALRREGHYLARLEHPNIVTVHDLGVMEGRPYLVLGYVDAMSLAEVLREGPFSAEEAVRIAQECAAGLSHAHGSGIIHRDLKPSNVLLREDGRVWLVDFGIASMASARQMTWHSQSTMARAGSMAYMAPERWREEGDPTVAEDVYGLGVLLYEMVMGFPPQGVFPAMESEGKPLPALQSVVVRALAHDPALRWASMDAFAAALQTLEKTTPSPRSTAALATPSGQPELAVRRLWRILLVGFAFFIAQTFMIGRSNEEQFSLLAGPGHKLFDAAIALIVCNLILIGVWTYLVWSTWLAGRNFPNSPSRKVVMFCYAPVVLCIFIVATLAVCD